MIVVYMFFFSSRRRHTRCSRDWSSDVCSSDLVNRYGAADREAVAKAAPTPTPAPKEIQKTFGEQLEDLADSLEEPAVQEQIRTAKRSEEHTSELQSRLHLVCRLLLAKKNHQIAD